MNSSLSVILKYIDSCCNFCRGEHSDVDLNQLPHLYKFSKKQTQKKKRKIIYNIFEYLKIFCPNMHLNVVIAQNSVLVKYLLIPKGVCNFQLMFFQTEISIDRCWILGTTSQFLNMLTDVWDFGYDSWRQATPRIPQINYCLH